jgi:D-alanyl-D-alanine carboxypeptidase
VRGKSGSLRATNALAGYVEPLRGQAMAFAVIVEGLTDASAVKEQMDSFVEGLCAY